LELKDFRGTDLTILIPNEDGFGLACITAKEDELFSVDMYQNRIKLDAKTDDEIYEDLENSKSYYKTCPTIIECLNGILDFWFIDPVTEKQEVKTYESIIEAIKFNKDTKEIIVFEEVI